MATGLVQQVKINPSLDVAFVWLGPTTSNTVLYYVLIDRDSDEVEAAIRCSMIDALTAAAFSGHTVTLATDPSNASSILTVTINPS
jgi:hypothetical protein